MPPVQASGPHPQYGRLHPPCVLSTAAVLQMKFSAALIVATLSHSVPALRSCSFSSLLLLECFFLFSYIALVFHVATLTVVLGVRSAVSLAVFLSAFTAPHHKSPRWRPFLAQVNVPIGYRICFCNLSFLRVGSLALRKPLYPPGEVVLPYSPLTTCVAGQWVYSMTNPQGKKEDLYKSDI